MQENRKGQVAVDTSYVSHSGNDFGNALSYVYRFDCLLSSEAAGGIAADEGHEDCEANYDAYCTYDYREGVQGKCSSDYPEEPYPDMDEQAYERPYVQNHRYEAQEDLRRVHHILWNRWRQTRSGSGGFSSQGEIPVCHRIWSH